MDFSFGLINRENIDYGLRVEEFRQSALDATVRDSSFWANALAVGVLGTVFIFIYWQSRQNQSIRFSSTRLLTSYENELAVVRDRFARLSAEYKQIKHAADEQMEGTVRLKPPATKRENAASVNRNNMERSSVGGNGQATVELQTPADDSSLNQQLAGANDTIGSLRRQVTALTRRIEEEQQKNRKLRGE